MILPGSYANGFAPRDGRPLYPELWRGCVGAWAPCLGPTGLALRDWSGYGQHGAINNTTAAAVWTPNGGKYALTFDGSDDEVAVPDNAAHKPTSFTVCCWVRCTSNTAGYLLFKQNSRNTVYEAYGLVNDSGILATVIASSGGTQGVITVARSLNVWYHLTATFRQPNLTLFLDGRQVGTATHNFAVDYGTKPFTLGRTTGSPSFPFAGQVDDPRIYDRVLTANEIRVLASRRGIAYEMAPRRRASVPVVAAFNRRRRLLLGSI
jgi:hypothetical protein